MLKLVDSADGAIWNLVVYGKSKQKTYRGINLLATASPTDHINCLITSNDDGSITLNGDPNSSYRNDGWARVSWTGTAMVPIDVNKTYIWQVRYKNESASKNLYAMTSGWVYKNGEHTNSGYTWTQTTVDGNLRCSIFKITDTSGSWKFSPWLYLGNATDSKQDNVDVTITYYDYMLYQSDDIVTTYEPYVGAAASPSRKYPQDIQITSFNKIESMNKNLICNFNNITLSHLKWLDGDILTSKSPYDDSRNWYSSGTHDFRNIKLKPNTTYCMTLIVVQPTTFNYSGVHIMSSNGGTLSTSTHSSDWQTLKIGDHKSLVFITRDDGIINLMIKYEGKCRIQIEEGPSFTRYCDFTKRTSINFNSDIKLNAIPVEIIPTGKNMIDNSNIKGKNGNSCSIENLKVEPNTQYTISLSQTLEKFGTNPTYQHWVKFYDKNNNQLNGSGWSFCTFTLSSQFIGTTFTKSWTFTTHPNCDHMMLFLGGYNGDYDTIMITNYIQMEKGNSATSYEDYYAPEVLKGFYTDSNGQKWASDYINYEDNILYQIIKKFTISDNHINTYWHSASDSNVYYADNVNIFNDAISLSPLLSTQFICMRWPSIMTSDKCDVICMDPNPWIRFRLSDSGLSKDEFKSLVRGAEIYYISRNATETQLFDIDAYRNIKISTYYDHTNIQISPDDGLVGKIIVEYQTDKKNHIDQVFNELKSTIS